MMTSNYKYFSLAQERSGKKAGVRGLAPGKVVRATPSRTWENTLLKEVLI